MVKDDQEGEFYSSITAGPVFSADGGHLAYGVKKIRENMIVVDGKEKPAVATVESIALSPDGKRVAYIAKKGLKQMFVVDSEPEVKFDVIQDNKIVFSPDGQHVAYTMRAGSKWAVVKDGKPGKEYDRVMQDTLTFSPDSKTLVSSGRDGLLQSLDLRQPNTPARTNAESRSIFND